MAGYLAILHFAKTEDNLVEICTRLEEWGFLEEWGYIDWKEGFLN
jgi:hypothetical protein